MMKPFDDLTDDELVTLRDEDVKFYIDYACAEEGVKLLPPQTPAPPTKELPPHDLTAYFIGSSPGEFTTLDRDHAMRVVDAMNSQPAIHAFYIPGPTLEQKAIQRTDPYVINSKPLYSEAMVAKVGEQIQRFAVEKKDYDEAKADYEKTRRAREQIAERIHYRIDAAYTKDRRRRDLLALHGRYLELANGDRTIAARFLRRAHPDALDVLPDVFVGVELEPMPLPIADPSAAPVSVIDDDIPY